MERLAETRERESGLQGRERRMMGTKKQSNNSQVKMTSN